MHTERIDRANLFAQVRQAADNTLGSFRDDAVKKFAVESKNLLESAFEEFILENDRYYSSDARGAIKDKRVLLAFTDAADGYLHQMMLWMQDNPITLASEVVSSASLSSLGILERHSVRNSVMALLGGNILIVGLRLLTGAGWVWWLELVVLYATYKIGMKGHQEDLLWEHKVRKDALVREIISDMSGWLDAAENKHLEVLKSFGI